MKTINEAFGQIARRLRNERGWSQLDLEVELETTSKYISDVELGKRNVSLLFAKRVADVYGLTLYQLFEMIEKEMESSPLLDYLSDESKNGQS